MEAIPCAHCAVVGTPSTMFRTAVEAEIIDGEQRAVIGAVCFDCARDQAVDEAAWMREPVAACMPETLFDSDADPMPRVDDLQDVAEREAAWLTGRAVARMDLETLRARASVTSVPYGSTMAHWEYVDLSPGELVDAALRAFEDAELVWSGALSIGTDAAGEHVMVLVRRGDMAGGGAY